MAYRQKDDAFEISDDEKVMVTANVAEDRDIKVFAISFLVSH
jgi:hypothetical protein